MWCRGYRAILRYVRRKEIVARVKNLIQIVPVCLLMCRERKKTVLCGSRRRERYKGLMSEKVERGRVSTIVLSFLKRSCRHIRGPLGRFSLSLPLLLFAFFLVHLWCLFQRRPSLLSGLDRVACRVPRLAAIYLILSPVTNGRERRENGERKCRAFRWWPRRERSMIPIAAGTTPTDKSRHRSKENMQDTRGVELPMILVSTIDYRL